LAGKKVTLPFHVENRVDSPSSASEHRHHYLLARWSMRLCASVKPSERWRLSRTSSRGEKLPFARARRERGAMQHGSPRVPRKPPVNRSIVGSLRSAEPAPTDKVLMADR
jgi:hypothetical protein